MRMITAALGADDELRVVFSVREEYVAQLDRYADEAVAAAAKRASVSEHKLRAAIECELITSAGTRSAVFASPEERADLPDAALDELARRARHPRGLAIGRWLDWPEGGTASEGLRGAA